MYMTVCGIAAASHSLAQGGEIFSQHYVVNKRWCPVGRNAGAVG